MGKRCWIPRAMEEDLGQRLSPREEDADQKYSHIETEELAQTLRILSTFQET